jgi:hypothetical protein
MTNATELEPSGSKLMSQQIVDRRCCSTLAAATHGFRSTVAIGDVRLTSSSQWPSGEIFSLAA